MPNDPLDTVYALAERAYLRLQAGDVLIRCLEEGKAAPLQRMVESLILSGPKNLVALQEILEEISIHQQQLEADLHQSLTEFVQQLTAHRVKFSLSISDLDVQELTPVRLLGVMRNQAVMDEEVQLECLQLLRDVREIAHSLQTHLSLLQEIETFTMDWMWGLAYQSAHQKSVDFRKIRSEQIL